jgi:hypothetical protein
MCLAWSRVEKGHVHLVEVLQEKSYAPINPKLLLQGEVIPILFRKSFKFLGRKIGGTLNDSQQQQHLLEQCEDMLTHTHNLPLSGAMKLWIYNNYIVAVLSWQMMIYDPARVWGKRLEQAANPFLKIWAGLAYSATPDLLYLPQDQKGLGLKNLSIVLTQLQVSKFHLLKHSQDPKVQGLYNYKKEVQEGKKRWNPIKELEQLERTVAINKLTEGSQIGTAGLGSNNNNKKHKSGDEVQDNRKEVLEACKEKMLHERMAHLHNLAIQGQWLQWDKNMTSD